MNMGFLGEIAEELLSGDTVCLVVNAAALGILGAVYRQKYKNYEAVKTARQFEISENLSVTLNEDYPNGTCVHAIIRGAVQATGGLVASKNVKGAQGVIQRSMLIEHKMKWNPFSRFWTHTERVIQDRYQTVQFMLVPATGGGAFIKKVPGVEIPAPLESRDLPLRVVYDEFTPNVEGFSKHFLGWLSGEQSQGLQETEELLQEGTILTAFGTLTTDGTGATHMVSPKDGTLILTSETPQKLTERLHTELRYTKWGCTIFMITATGLAAYIVYRLYNNYKKRKLQRSDSVKREALRKKRRREARSSDDNGPMCVICLSTHVEVLLLECGHLCLCADCADQLKDNCCPICRATITRIVAAFLP